MKTCILTAMVLCLPMLFVSAAFGQTAATTTTTTTTPILFNFDPAGTTGPAFWGSLSPAFATCGTTVTPSSSTTGTFVPTGLAQSPIDIVSANAVQGSLAALTFRYTDTPFVVQNTGSAVQLPVVSGSSFRLGGFAQSPLLLLNWSQPSDEYQLQSVRFRAPSEHTINGKAYDMEAQLVHVNQIGETAIVAVLMSVGDSGNGTVEQIVSQVPSTVTSNTVTGSTFNALGILPQNTSYYLYSGSLTGPPCTEGVRWFVLTNPVSVSNSAVQQLHAIIRQFPGFDQPNNNRPVRPLNGRTVVVGR